MTLSYLTRGKTAAPAGAMMTRRYSGLARAWVLILGLMFGADSPASAQTECDVVLAVERRGAIQVWHAGDGLREITRGACAALQWRPAITRHRPILWILHASYAWIPFGLALLAAARFGWIANSVGVHALAIGATAGLIIGMITRTARGHTGRALQVSRPEATAYVLVMLAAATRVLLPLGMPPWVPMALVVSAAAWSLAFAIYLFIYTPWLLQTRLDGKDG